MKSNKKPVNEPFIDAALEFDGTVHEGVPLWEDPMELVQAALNAAAPRQGDEENEQVGYVAPRVARRQRLTPKRIETA